jgi:hypothetical protein
MTGARYFAKQNERRRAAGLAEVRARAGAEPAHRCDACGKRVASLLEAVNWCDTCNADAQKAEHVYQRRPDHCLIESCVCGGAGCDACEGSL